MWEETLVKTDLESQPKSLDINLPSFKGRADSFLIILIVTSSASIIIVAVKFRIFHQWIEFLQSNSYLRAAFYPLVLSTVFIIAGIIFRTLIWFRYRPVRVRTGESIDWPFVSVIMPALNEEELIEESIDSIFSCNYPLEKFEVICINDGSTDTTLFQQTVESREMQSGTWFYHW